MTDGEMNEIESDVDRMMDKIEAATMNKAILILELPDRCGHCRLSAMVKYYAMCMVTGLECVENGRPSWCPLRETPEYRLEWYDDDQSAFEQGYNQCLREIIGEEEDERRVGINNGD